MRKALNSKYCIYTIVGAFQMCYITYNRAKVEVNVNSLLRLLSTFPPSCYCTVLSQLFVAFLFASSCVCPDSFIILQYTHPMLPSLWHGSVFQTNQFVPSSFRHSLCVICNTTDNTILDNNKERKRYH